MQAASGSFQLTQQFRRPLAQAFLLVVAGSVFLTWVSTATGDTTPGIDFDQGRLTIMVAAITIGFIQLGWRPAWIGSGLVVAVLGRELLEIRDSAGLEPGVGLWLGTMLAVATLGLLVWDMFSAIDRTPAEEVSEEPESGHD